MKIPQYHLVSFFVSPIVLVTSIILLYNGYITPISTVLFSLSTVFIPLYMYIKKDLELNTERIIPNKSYFKPIIYFINIMIILGFVILIFEVVTL